LIANYREVAVFQNLTNNQATVQEMTDEKKADQKNSRKFFHKAAMQQV
jgi:hypothetical protein